MNAAHVTWLLSVRGGGIPPVVFSLAQAQRACGHNIRVFGVEDPAADALGEALTAASTGPLSLGWSPSLSRALSAEDAEILHLHGLFTLVSRAARTWGRRTGRPVIVTPHGMLEPWALANSRWKKVIFRWVVENDNLRRAACVQALCATEARNIRALGLKCPIAVIPNGVDVPVEGGGKAGAFANRYPSTAKRRLLLFLGRIHPKKGLLHLLRAWAGARRQAPGEMQGWMLVVAGPDQGGHAKEVARLAGDLGLTQEVLFTGPLYGAAKHEAFAGASAFILPSFSEGVPVAVLEAMAWRLPVLITRQCNLDVEESGSGLLAEPDARSVQAQIVDFVQMTAAQRRAMGERGRCTVEAHYTWDRVSRDLVDLYGWALGGRARPACVVD